MPVQNEIFDEVSLRDAIHATWGEFGAHAEVYAGLLAEVSLLRKLQKEFQLSRERMGVRAVQSPRCVEPSAPIHPCANCGKPVHTCEAQDASGKDNHVCPVHREGIELEDGRWVCSPECEDFVQAPLLTEEQEEAEVREAGHPDDEAVDLFAAAMKAKLAQKRAEGRSGWDDPDECHIDFLVALLHGHIQKGDPVDVANIAMMLWSRGLRGNGSIPAPRLTEEQEEAIRQAAQGCDCDVECPCRQCTLRAAFPELGKEVGRG